MNYKKIALYFIYFSLAIIVITINAHYIVEWLNRSLFIDYSIDYERVSETFYNGKSIVILLTVFIFSIFGSVIISILFTNIIAAALVLANNIKVQERNDLLTFSELKLISSPKDVLALIEISTGTVFIALIGITIFLIVLHLIIHKIGRKIGIRFNYKFRTVIFIITSALFIGIYTFPNEFNEKFIQFKQSNIHNHNPLKKAQRDGFIPTLIATMKPDYMDKPGNYKKNQLTTINEKYRHLAEEINEDRNHSIQDDVTVLYLSESLMNPDQIRELLTSEEKVLPKINTFIDNNYGGTMYSQFIGGGTANIEWSVLTSFSLEVFRSPVATTPYSDFYVDSPNHSTIISNMDKQAIALHPYSAHLYKRRAIYSKVGFAKFKFLKNGIKHTKKLGKHTRVSDASLNKDIFRELQNDNIGLLHVLSMQNHSPYTRSIPDSPFKPKINKAFFKKEKRMN